MKFYKLRGKEPVPLKDVLEWGKWFETADRTVVNTIIQDVRVSTVFVGLDNSFDDNHQELFETMIFGGANDQYCEKYATWDEAVKGHHEACKLVLT